LTTKWSISITISKMKIKSVSYPPQAEVDQVKHEAPIWKKEYYTDGSLSGDQIATVATPTIIIIIPDP